ncbi:HD domain-containing protein [Candidatus Uabimicrobium sp. HlEnr_7]|uniref:HD domain-containing protein n=1 Tax=Candidatus Uabimicrobium helgolandensis TaxID=3095367 RepID=UPI0035576C63
MNKTNNNRRAIALEAAKMLHAQQEIDYYIAKKRAAQSLGISFFHKENVPSNKEVRHELQRLIYFYESPNLRESVDKYNEFKMLLLPLEDIKHNSSHPEGDMLYHSLQVFELAKEWHGYDVEFLQAALLHDIGKAFDPQHHAAAGAHAIEGLVSKRVFFLIRYHSEAQLLAKGKLGHKAKVILKQSEYFSDLTELDELNKAGRIPGAEVCSLDEALLFIKNTEQEIDDW